jgi:hypothetical protein
VMLATKKSKLVPSRLTFAKRMLKAR